MSDQETAPDDNLLSAKSILLLVSIAILALVLGIVVANQLKPAKPEFKGYPSISGDFSLQSVNGPVALQDFRGKVVALYFGFASCPDVCPTSLGVMSSAIKSLDAAQQAAVIPMFISVDPDRDSPERLATYTKSFHPDMIGLTGTREQIDAVTGQYRMLYKIVPMEDSAMGYTVDHASTIYVIGRNGIVQSLLQHGTPPTKVAEKIKAALDI